MPNARRPIAGLRSRDCTRAEPFVCCGSAVDERYFVPALELAMKVPQLHRRAFAPALRDRKRGLIVAGFELAIMIDVAAEAVHEIQAVIEHRHNPPAADTLLYQKGAPPPNRRRSLS